MEVSDAEVAALVYETNPPLAAVVRRLLGEKDAARQAVIDRALALADAWDAVGREPPGEFDRAFRAAAGLLREVLGQEDAAVVPPAKVPDESAAGEGMRDWDLLVTVRVYGGGSAIDAAGALCTGRGTFALPGDGEVEILTARPA